MKFSKHKLITILERDKKEEEQNFVAESESLDLSIETPLETCLERLPIPWLNAVNTKGLGLPETSKTRTAVKQVTHFLLNENGLHSLVEELPDSSLQIITALVENGRSLPMDRLLEQFSGTNDITSDWNHRPPLSSLGLLRLAGLVYVFSPDDTRTAFIPPDLAINLGHAGFAEEINSTRADNILYIRHQNKHGSIKDDPEFPGHNTVHLFDVARQYLQNDREYAAENLLRRLLRFHDTDPEMISEICQELGLIYYRRNDCIPAYRLLIKSLERDPEQPLSLLTAGLILNRYGSSRKAHTSLRDAFELAPDSPHIQSEYAFSLAEQYADPKSIELARDAAEVSPEYLFNYISVLREFNQFDKALQAIESAQQRGIDNEHIYEIEELIRQTIQMKEDISDFHEPDMESLYQIYLDHHAASGDTEPCLYRKTFAGLQNRFSRLLKQVDYGIPITAIDMKEIYETGIRLKEFSEPDTL